MVEKTSLKFKIKKNRWNKKLSFSRNKTGNNDLTGEEI